MNINFGLFPPLAQAPTRATRRHSACAAPAKTLAKKRALTRARACRSRALDQAGELIAPSQRNEARLDRPATSIAGRWRAERGAQARRVLHGGARPLPTAAGEVEAVLRRHRRGPVVERSLGAPSVRTRAPRAGDRRHARHCAAAALRRSAGPDPRLDRRRRRCTSPSRTAMRLFPLGQGGACASCTARASATTISPRSRTGCADATARAYLTDFQLAASFLAAQLACFGSPPMRICGICSSTSAAMLPDALTAARTARAGEARAC